MIYQPTREIENAIKAHDWKCSVMETENSSSVKVSFDGEVAKNLTIRFISTDNDNDFAVRCFSIANAPDAKIPAVLRAVNQANNQFRFVKFILDKDNDINAEFDFPQHASSVGESAAEMVIRFVSIIDEAYPKFMSAIWG